MPLLAPIPADDAARLAEVRSLSALNANRDERFERVSRIACRLFEVPVAMVAWMDEETQFIKSVQGIELSQAPRDISFCGHTIFAGGSLVVEDTHKDERFADNPWVVNEPHVRFYAGYPIRGPQSGHIVGTVCLYDLKPKRFDPSGVRVLSDLARLVEQCLAADWSVELSVALQRRSQELAEHFEKTRDLIYWSHSSGEVAYINSAMMRRLGFAPGNPPSRLPEFLIDDEGPPGVTHILATQTGERIWARGEGTPGRAGDKDVVRWMLRDVGVELENEHRLLHEAETDELTAAFNRRGFSRRLGDALSSHKKFTLAMVDMDHLKQVNDKLGHSAGDQAIQDLVVCLKQAVRSTDIVGRFGGDEFVVLLLSASIDAARTRFEHFHRIFADVAPTVEGVVVTASVGLVEVQGGKAEDVIRAVDEKLYEAKRTGRNQTVG